MVTQELKDKIRQKIVSLTGEDPGPVNLRDVFPGSNPNVTEDQIADEIAKSMVLCSLGDFEEVSISEED